MPFSRGRIGYTGQICQESGMYTAVCCHRTPIALSKDDRFPVCQRGNHAAVWNLFISTSMVDYVEELPNLGETILDQWKRKQQEKLPKPIIEPLKPGESLLGRYFKQQVSL